MSQLTIWIENETLISVPPLAMIAMAASQDGETEQFAYGTNEMDGCECPAVAVGFDPKNEAVSGLASMVGRYDMEIEAHPPVIGTTDEARARAAWLEALEHWREEGVDDAVEVGEEVAEELGWIEA